MLRFLEAALGDLHDEPRWPGDPTGRDQVVAAERTLQGQWVARVAKLFAMRPAVADIRDRPATPRSSRHSAS